VVDQLKSWWRRRPWVFIVAGAAILIVAAFGAARVVRSAPSVPTAEVKIGEFVDRVQVRGEVKALRSVALTAPSGTGDLQIVKLVKNGTQVKPGDLVAQFDTTQLQRQLEQRQTDLKTAEAEIERTRAQHRLTAEQLKTDLEKARYDVDRAKLELGKAEILSKIDGEKARIALGNAERILAEVQERMAANDNAAAAELESRKQKREKSLFDVRQAQANIARMTLTASAAGLITLMPNFRAGMFGNWPEFKEGDRAWPGASIAELPDLSTVRATGRIEEADRGRMKTGQDAVVRADAVPDKEMTGKIVDISPVAKVDLSGWPPKKNFDFAIQIDQLDARVRPGMSATARIAVERLPNSILIPVEALFNKRGRNVVYVLRGSKFEEREVAVLRRGGGQLVIAKNLSAGERVATVDPALAQEQ